MNAIALLTKAATQFRIYESNHRSKAARFANEGASQNSTLIEDTLAKADVNRDFAVEIEEFLTGYDPTTQAVSRPELVNLLRSAHDTILQARRTIEEMAPKADAYDTIAQLARLTVQRQGGYAQADILWELKQAVDKIVAEREEEREAS